MKKVLSGMVFAGLAVFAATAGTVEDIAYYEENAPKTGDFAYLESRCKLDLSTPEGIKDFPTVVWFHGGGLSGGSKHFPDGLNKDKIAVAAVNYRLSGKGGQCPDYIYDAAAAAAWVRKHIAEYGGDPEKVYIAGHSAGGYLSIMLALAPQYLKAFGLTPLDFAGYFPVSGQMTTHFRILAERSAAGIKVPEVVLDEFAPIQLAGENAPVITLLVGDPEIEWASRVEENQLLAARLKYVYHNDNVKIYSFPGFDHSTVRFPALALINQIVLHRKK